MRERGAILNYSMGWACWIYVVGRHTCGVEGWFLTLSSRITFWQSLGKQYRMPGTESSSVTCKPNMPYPLYSLTPNMLMLIIEFFLQNPTVTNNLLRQCMMNQWRKYYSATKKDELVRFAISLMEWRKHQHHEILFICCI